MEMIQVTLNGKTYGRETFSKVAAFVQQDDILYGTLTVRGKGVETFRDFLVCGGAETVAKGRGRAQSSV